MEEKTGYHKVYFFIASVLIFTGIVGVVGGRKLIVDLAGFVYPAYMCFKSMEAGSKDDTQWLTYWVVFSFMSILESILFFLRTMIPFFYFIKLAAIVYMYHPSTRGAETIYTQGLRPVLLPYISSKTE